MSVPEIAKDTRPIGVFDSGMGGLSVLRAMARRMPEQSYLYFGDTARAPYGNRCREELRQFTVEIGKWLITKDCKMLLIACNTAAALGGEALAAESSVPVYGMTEAVMAATLGAEQEIDWPLGMVATQATVNSGVYQAAFAQAAPGKPFYAQACPAFVPFVEKGCLDGPAVEQAARAYLAPMMAQGIKTLVLGCTHHPFLTPVLRRCLGPDVRIVDPADAMAELMVEKIKGTAESASSKAGADGTGTALTGTSRGEMHFYSSGNVENFAHLAGRLLEQPIERAERQVF